MSLLLDALKQAEKNKASAQKVEKTTGRESQTLLRTEDVTGLNADDVLAELEILPELDDFDLTIYPDHSTPITEPVEGNANTFADTISLEPSVPVENRTDGTDQQAQQDVEIPVEISARLNKSDNEHDISSQESATLEQGRSKNNTDNKGKNTAAAPEQQTVVTQSMPWSDESNTQSSGNIELAESLLRISRTSKKKSYLPIALVILAALVTAAGYLYSLTLTTPDNIVAVTRVIDTDSADNKSDTVQDLNRSDQTFSPSTGQQREELHTSEMAKATHQKASPIPVNKAIMGRPNFDNQQPSLRTEPESQAIHYPEAIRVSVNRKTPKLALYLTEAYRAYQNRDYVSSLMLYRQVISLDPDNIDGLLGLGAIAEQQGNRKRAQMYFEKVLTLDGNNTFARTALVRLQQSRFPSGHASQYKTLIEEGLADAGTYSALGSIYASEQSWHEAQSAYFEAVKRHPDHVDYIYNLAVSLDHLGKSTIALRYYRQALSLSINVPSGFNRMQVEERIRQLQKQ